MAELTGNTKKRKLVGCKVFALITQGIELSEFENLSNKSAAHTRLISRPHYNWVDFELRAVGLQGRGHKGKLSVLKTPMANSRECE